METIVFKVHSMTCYDCEPVVEKAALSVEGVSMAKSYYDKGLLIVSFEAPCNKRKIKRAVEAAGHTLTVEKEKSKENILVFAITVAVLVFCKMIGFTGKWGNPLVLEESASYLMVFAFGLLTSLHCLSMCGGFTLTENCAFEREDRHTWYNSVQYHCGRLVGYTTVGAVLGLVGHILAITVTIRVVIGLAAGVLMVLMALNMFFHIGFMRRIRMHLPSGMQKALIRLGAHGPFATGIVNALMPCGPLQSVQLFAIAKGTVLGGACSMFIFCFGTVPLLLGVGALIGFLKVQWRKWITLGSASMLFLLGAFLVNNCFLKLI